MRVTLPIRKIHHTVDGGLSVTDSDRLGAGSGLLFQLL
jgi:hypothetical protein